MKANTLMVDSQLLKWDRFNGHVASPNGTVVLADFARTLEVETQNLKIALSLSDIALTACHAAMLGKVNPKDKAWCCLYAAQDARTVSATQTN